MSLRVFLFTLTRKLQCYLCDTVLDGTSVFVGRVSIAWGLFRLLFRSRPRICIFSALAVHRAEKALNREQALHRERPMMMLFKYLLLRKKIDI